MSFDPFSTETPKTEEKKETVTVTNQNEGKVTITLKGGTGFDSPWVVIHAQDAADALAQLNDPEMGNLIKRTAEVGEFFAGLKQPATPKPSAPRQPAPATPSAPSGESRQCEHGEMLYKEGFNETKGKAWRGYFCPSRDRAAQCKPEFLR